MNWFKGEIAEAIVISKTKQAIFVVYIEGKDEKSTQITELINKEEISKILGSDSFVAIKIEAESVPYQQFSQIYKQVPIPSIYFIGKQGVPLKVVTEAQDVDSFKDMLNLILQKGGLTPLSTQSQNFIEKEQSTPAPPNVVCENGVCTIKNEHQPSTSQQSEPGPEEKSIEKPKELTAEEKMEKVKELLEKKREEKKREEEEKERLKELERRKMGQGVQQLKRWQDDQELKHVLEEREKEKRESQAARERVLAQIAQDKAERAARFSSNPPQQPQAPPAPQATPKPVSNPNTARLQFRMPDGRTATQDFGSAETLDSVHAHIRANLQLPFAHYALSTTFPRREFTEEDRSRSLLELGLAPTAVILILPVNRGTVAAGSGGGLTGLLWSVLMPIFSLLGFLKSFLFGTGQNPGSSNGGKRAAEAASDQRSEAKVRRAGESTVIKRQGNVHRLSNKNDSDDENNTWNGNSTQQM